MSSTYGDQTHILIEIKLLRPSPKIKFIQVYSKRSNWRIYYTYSCNNYTEIVPILWYKYKNSFCSSISCLIYFRLEICVLQILPPPEGHLCLSSFSKQTSSTFLWRRHGSRKHHPSIFKEENHQIYIWRRHKD